MIIIDWVYDNLLDDYDYFAFGGDDSFWIVPNLRHYLLTDPRVLHAEKDNQPLYMGNNFSVKESHKN